MDILSLISDITQKAVVVCVERLSEKDISNVVVQRRYKLPWFASELPEKDISNVVVQYSTINQAVVVCV